jgi:replicative DNA helicase
MEQAQNLVDQLQQKYVDLTNNTQQTIETTFNEIQKVFENKSIALYALPLRAKKL